MARRLFSIIFLACLGVALSATALRVSAQQPTPPDAPQPATSEAPPPSYDTPPAITQVDGTARLLRQGRSQPAVASMPLIEGDRIVTEAGRVAVTFPDGSLLHIDRNTTVDFLSMSLMRILEGRVILVAAAQGDQRASVDYQIDAPAGSARVQTAGEYRVSTLSRELELDVVSGTASLATDLGSARVEAGERSFAREGEAPSYAEAFNSARLDAFDQWSQSQRDVSTGDVSGPSSQYLPSDLNAYSSTFDRDGRWENDPSYGSVWYPTVSVGWRPYYNGYWDNVGPYGWTWIGYDRWAWPTHHFGRWGFRSGSWFWIPGRHWGPAWVSWGYSPSYYSWCPLDFFNRPVVSLLFGNRFGFRGAFDPFLCWTVIPRQHFGTGNRVASYAVGGARLPATARSAFVIRRGGPESPVAVARNVGGSGFGGARAVPRALPGVTMQARPRESAFGAARATPRGSSPGGSPSTTPRYDRRSLPYSTAPAQRYDRGGATPGSAVPRGSTSQATPYDNRTPSSRVAPRGSDRPPTTAQPRGYQSSPNQYRAPASPAPSTRGQSYSAPRGSDRPPTTAQPRGYQSSPNQFRVPGSSAPRETAPARPRGDSYPVPRYSAPPTRGQSYTAPRYSAPPAPRYSAPAAPRYSAPPAPRYSAPSAYPAPRYSAPPAYSAPRSSAPPSYSSPRSASPGYAAPRAGGGSAPRSAPPASSRPAPSGSSRSGGRGR
jgi:hypothetical protein